MQDLTQQGGKTNDEIFEDAVSGEGTGIKFSDGTKYERDASGQLVKVDGNPKKLNWRLRAIRAENAFIQMVDERKLLQNLLLEKCKKLEEMGFECDAGKLVDCHDFREIMSFARGVPEIVRPALEEMPLNGARAVKRIRVTEGEDLDEVVLECGHEVKVPKEESKGLRPNTLVICNDCVMLLKERDMFDETPIEEKTMTEGTDPVAAPEETPADVSATGPADVQEAPPADGTACGKCEGDEPTTEEPTADEEPTAATEDAEAPEGEGSEVDPNPAEDVPTENAG